MKKSNYEWAFDSVKKLSQKMDVIAEIGSRDGLDSIILAKTFRSDINYIFEADPSLIKLIRQNVEKTKNQDIFKIFNIAVGNQNKDVQFFAVDTDKYNNLGVGSLYKINFGNREKNDLDLNKESVQKAINIKMKKYSSLNLETPDLIAMDVQGAELDVLKGFENQLNEVKFIILETNISENYIGAPKFLEVHNYLKNNFMLHLSSRHGKKNFRLFLDNFKYRISFKKNYQGEVDLLYVNREFYNNNK